MPEMPETLFREQEGVYFFKEGTLVPNTETYELVIKIKLPLIESMSGKFLDVLMCEMKIPRLCTKYNNMIMALNHRVATIRSETNNKLQTYFQFTRPVPNNWQTDRKPKVRKRKHKHFGRNPHLDDTTDRYLYQNNPDKYMYHEKAPYENNHRRNKGLYENKHGDVNRYKRHTGLRNVQQLLDSLQDDFSHMIATETLESIDRLPDETSRRKAYKILKYSYRGRNQTLLDHINSHLKVKPLGNKTRITIPPMGADDIRVAKYRNTQCEYRRRMNALIDEIRLNRRGVINLREESYYFANAVIEKTKEIATIIESIKAAERMVVKELDTIKNVTMKMDIRHQNMHRATIYLMDLMIKVSRWERTLDSVLAMIDEGLKAMHTETLSPLLVTPKQLLAFLKAIEQQIHIHHPNYEMVYTNPFNYFFVKGVAYVLTNDAIYISVPVPIKVVEQGLFTLYSIRILPMHLYYRNHGYRKIEVITKYNGFPSHVAFQGTKMIELSQEDIDHCSNVNDNWVCNQLLIIRDGDKENCLLRMFYGRILTQELQLRWKMTGDGKYLRYNQICTRKMIHYDGEPSPAIIENETHIIVANTQDPWKIFYDYNKQDPITLPTVRIAAIPKTMMCRKRIRIGSLTIPSMHRGCNETFIMRTEIEHPLKTILDITNNLDKPQLINQTEHLFELRNFSKILNYSLHPLVLDKALQAVDDDHFLVDPRVNPYRGYYDEEPLVFSKTHHWLLYGAIVTAALALLVFLVLFLRHRSLHAKTDSFIKTSSLPPAAVASQLPVPSEAKAIEELCAKSAVDSHTILVGAYIVAFIITLYILYRAYKYCRKRMVHETTILLQLKSNDTSETLPLKTISGFPTDVYIYGHVEKKHILIEKNWFSDKIHFPNNTFSLFHDARPLLVPTFCVVPMLLKSSIRNIIAEGITDAKILTSHGNFIHTPKNVSDLALETRSIKGQVRVSSISVPADLPSTSRAGSDSSIDDLD